MGLLRWIRRKMIGFDPSDPSDVERLATEYLKISTKIHSDTLRTAQKINQARLMSLQERQLRRELQESLDDDDDFEEDEEEESPEGQQLTNKLINLAVDKFLTKSKPSNDEISDIRKEAGEAFANLSDKQLLVLKQKGLF